MTYQTGHVKRNTATGAVAIRTIFHPDLFPELVWLVATTSSGGKNATQAEVEGEDWIDLYSPEE